MKKLRVFYMAGPGDVVGTYEHWKDGRDDPSQVSIAYSRQFYDLCRDLGAAARVVSYCPEPRRLRDGDFDVENLPVPLQNRSGVLFHLGWYLFGWMAAWRALRCRADVAVLMTGTHFLPYWLLRLAGVRIVLTQHCVLWPKRLGPRGAWKLVHALDRGFFKRADAILSISQDVTDQVVSLAGDRAPAARGFVPTYRRETFDAFTPADFSSDPFRVLFAGRIEEDKGALELIAIAERLRGAARPIVIDVAGDGGALAELRQRIADRGLSSAIVTHGYCERSRMRELYAASHAVLVPTQESMIEGFNKVVAESVLARRPVLTSSVCPALEVVRGAAVEVASNEAADYADAIARLATDRPLYDEKSRAAESLREPFFDPLRGWRATVEKAIVDSTGGRAEAPVGPGEPAAYDSAERATPASP